MSRAFGPSDDTGQIDDEAVGRFFRGRAERMATLGPLHAVIYQDKHPTLAEQRDAAERSRLLPLLALNGTQRLLDLGCGTGRWVPTLLPLVSHYHGLDLTPGFVEYAQKRFGDANHAHFSIAKIDDFSTSSIGESQGFDRVLCAGVLIYLSDARLNHALRCILGAVEGADIRLLFREPVARDSRLTLSNHYSEELEQTYTAVYRTRQELTERFAEAFADEGYSLVDEGQVFDRDELNNRLETYQAWFLIGRS